MVLAWALQQNPRGVISTSTQGLIRDVPASNGPSPAATATALIIQELFPIYRETWKWERRLKSSETDKHNITSN